MIKIRLATANNRRQVIVDEDMTPHQLLMQEEVITEGAMINLDGISLTRDEFHEPLGDLVRGDTATLSVVVKSENA